MFNSTVKIKTINIEDVYITTKKLKHIEELASSENFKIIYRSKNNTIDLLYYLYSEEHDMRKEDLKRERAKQIEKFIKILKKVIFERKGERPFNKNNKKGKLGCK